MLYQVFPGTRSQCEKLLHRASRNGEIVIVEKLITFFDSEYAFVNSKDSNGNTALHYASKCNNIEICELLLQSGANVNICNSLLQSAFYLALDSIQKESGLLLLENSVNPDLKDRNNKSALEIVRNVELRRTMVDKRAQVSNIHKLYLNRNVVELEGLVKDHRSNFVSLRSRIHSGMTLLHIAAKYNTSEIIRVYSSLDIDINLSDSQGRAPLHYVTFKETAQLLLECGADCNSRDFKGNSVLHTMCCNAYTSSLDIRDAQECIGFLLKLGVSNLSANLDGLLPIHICAIHGNEELIETLLEGEYGQELALTVRDSALDQQVKSPLFYAVIKQKHSCIRPLVEHGLLFYPDEAEDLLIRTLSKEYPCDNIVNTTEFLLSQGANIWHKTLDSENNVLHLAVQLGPSPVIELLIKVGADVNHQNRLGETPLFIACRLDNDFAASKLLENSCDYTIVNKRKKTAFDYIRDYEQWIKGGLFKEKSEILARLRAHSLLSARDLVRSISKTIDRREFQTKVYLLARSKSNS